MSSRDEPPYDPYIPSGGAGQQGGQGQGQNGNHRTAALQAVRHNLRFFARAERCGSVRMSHIVHRRQLLLRCGGWAGLADSLHQRCDSHSTRPPCPCTVALRCTHMRCYNQSCESRSSNCFMLCVTLFADSYPGNRQHRRHYARQHQQGLRARRTPRLAAG
jgi:hypothetical protein